MGTLRDPSTINNVGTLGGATNPTTAQALPLERENQKAIRELVGTFGYEDLTISSGGITPTKAEVTVDTEAGASADDLTTIYLVSDGTTTLHDGMILKLRAYDPARTVTVKHGSGTNQIQTVSGTDIVLGTTWDLTLKLQSGVWKEIQGKPVINITGNAATATDMASGHVLHGADTASEVRAAIAVYSDTETDSAISTHNSSSTAHSALFEATGKILQKVVVTSNSSFSITAQITEGSLPTTSAGTEIISTSFTPKKAGSKIKVSVAFWGVGASASVNATLCQSGSSDVISAARVAGTTPQTVLVEGTFTAASTAAVTVSARAGRDSTSGTAYVNRLAGGAIFGTASLVVLTVEEIAA